MASKNRLTISFDIGHDSIGWAVLADNRPAAADPDVLGCGAVVFPADDCLASVRRNFRRMRRHIRATRQRIARMRRLLAHVGFLTAEQLDRPGGPAPWRLAARVLAGGPALSPAELWDVLRWYAHNRGYDANRLWSKGEDIEDDEDTKKVRNARATMDERGTRTMAETICALLGCDPLDAGWKPDHRTPAYRTRDAAFPREAVTDEVRRILAAHLGRLPGLNENVRSLLLEEGRDLDAAAAALAVAAGLRLPGRYHGGLLFGQLAPRFDNRIISRCAVSGGKVPARGNMDFLRFRWAMLVANLRLDGAPLTAPERAALNAQMEKAGSMTPAQLGAALGKIRPGAATNVEAFLQLHPDSANALVLDPALSYPRTSRLLKGLWPLVPEEVRGRISNKWKKGVPVSLERMAAMIAASGGDPAPFQESARAQWERGSRGGKAKATSWEVFSRTPRGPAPVSGRAPYSRDVMRKAYAEVMDGFDPRKPRRAAGSPDGDAKGTDGILYGSTALRTDVPLESLTNNHRVRHRMLLLGRLADSLLAKYAAGDAAAVRTVVVEVNRDLKELSGLTNKAIRIELDSRLKDFKDAVSYLEKHAPQLPLTGGLIRKARIAMDLGWECPFTGEKWDPLVLPHLDRAHIVPYAQRATDALHALVLARPEVNRMQGKRTSRAFIAECQGQAVPGRPQLSIRTLREYDAWVDALKIHGHKDDKTRQRLRKGFLTLDRYEEKDAGFTPGDLTRTSQLARLGMRQLAIKLPAARAVSLPGSVTAFIRRAWNLTGTLARAVPEVLDPATGTHRPKDEIRGITHLHHALDAVVLGLASHYLPKDGGVWEAMVRRKRTDADERMLAATGAFARSPDGARLKDLADAVKDRIGQRLAECRVVQHIPADMSGARLELNTWRVLSVEGDQVRYAQRSPAKVVDGRRVRPPGRKLDKCAQSKVVGLQPGKLSQLKGLLVIGENYGLALDPEPAIIPFHRVWHRIQELREANGGRMPRILRPGMLIRIQNSPPGSRQDYTGIWRIASTKNNDSGPAIDIVRPERIRPENKVAWAGINKGIAPLMKAGIEIPRVPLCGLDPVPA